ncbi:MAG: hypothetical protein ACRDR6_02025 [Pseudonocardiaceae bacterium]
MVVLARTAPTLFTQLTTGRALPLVVISALAGVVVLILLRRGVTSSARVVAAVAVTTVVWGWALAQYPCLLPPALTVRASAAPSGALITELVVTGLIAVLVGPSFILLFTLAQRGHLEESDDSSGALLREAQDQPASPPRQP